MTSPMTMGYEMTDAGGGDPTDDLTVQQVADMLGTNPARIRRWLRAGAFPEAWKPTDTPQAQWQIPRSSVIAWRNRGH